MDRLETGKELEPMKTGRILIIEDNPMNMELAADLLRIHGFEVIESLTALEGLAKAKNEAPDLILMDIALPDIDGLEASMILKNQPDTRDIPIIAFTAHAMKGDKEKALASKCSGYITKPIDTRRFAENVAQYLK